MRTTHVITRWVIAVSMVVMSLAGFASNQLLDEDAFADLIAGSIESSEVRRLLATKAVEVAIDASDADALLADALPEDLSLIATPALELSTPAIAEAGAQLLGIDQVGSSLDAAARSIHRQTASAILAEEDVDVTINTLPVLVVVADEIAGDVGARAAVGLDLPESATSIDLGSNQSVVWSLVRSLSYVAAAAVLIWLLCLLGYFATAPKGHRLLAARRLGRTFIKVGVVIAVATWLLLVVLAVVLEAALATGEPLSFGEISVGGFSEGGGIALAQVVFDPLMGSGRRTVLIGLAIICATYLLGGGAVAVALRSAVRNRDGAVLFDALLERVPTHLRHSQRALTLGLVLVLLLWPQISLRAALTVTALVLLALIAGWALTSDRPLAAQLRLYAEQEQLPLPAMDDRQQRVARERRWMLPAAAVVALLWPSYTTSGLVGLITLIAAAFGATFWWELRTTEVDEAGALAIAETDESGWSRRRKLTIAGVLALGVAVIGFGGDNANPAGAAAFALDGPAQCNGHEDLCDRPLDEVVFAGTHNSMSASELGWELANHEGAIPAQLAAGIRALLIDVQYWPQAASIESLDLDPEAAAIAAEALSVDQPPEDGLWMCHNLCQLGGTPFEDFLADLRAFLETNPDEVLVIVIQDDAPAADITAAIESAEIDTYAYAHEPGTPWPTLGEMIESNERLVFLAENSVDGSPWYQLAFDGNVSETGFRYSVVEDFDCSESRGGNDGSFFMINHWVETGLPVPSEADAVNDRSVLAARVEACQATRERTPGIIAVNFWERGDLLSYVDELNGVD